MPVCKFFMQGSCKFGNRCWNDHPSGGNQGFSATAQRQLFGKKAAFGGGGGSGGGGVTFRDSFGQNQNPYKWIAPDQQQQQQPSKNSQVSIQQISAPDIVKGLAGEVSTTWEGGKMWPFSCLGFEKDLPSLPGFEDISPEEMRNEAYEALKQGNMQAYMQKVETAFNQVNAQRQELKNPNMSLRQKLISFIEDCRRNKSSGNAQVSLFSDSSSNLFGGDGGLFGSGSNTQTGSGLFGSASTTQTGTGLFGSASTTQTGSGLFGSASNTQTGSGLFGAQSTGAQSGLFGQTGAQTAGLGQTGSQSLFGQSTFSQPQPDQASSVFGQPSLFGQQTQPAAPTGLFGKPATSSGGLFGQEPPSTPKQSLFGQPVGASSPFSSNGGFGSTAPTTPFGQSTVQPKTLFGTPTPAPEQASVQASVQPSAMQPAPATTVSGSSTQQDSVSTLYSPLDKLTSQELEQFKAPTFVLGSIPTRPPPKELCF